MSYSIININEIKGMRLFFIYLFIYFIVVFFFFLVLSVKGCFPSFRLSVREAGLSGSHCNEPHS